jgi:hypothetical protein
MLRLRKRPPAGPSTINGTPWSELDLSDLSDLLREQRTVAEIAEFLCRDVEEVEAKIAERRPD